MGQECSRKFDVDNCDGFSIRDVEACGLLGTPRDEIRAWEQEPLDGRSIVDPRRRTGAHGAPAPLRLSRAAIEAIQGPTTGATPRAPDGGPGSAAQILPPQRRRGPGEPPPGERQSLGLARQNYFALDLDELMSLPKRGHGALEEIGLVLEMRPTYTFCNGGTYKGQWRGNMRHGIGVQRWQDGSIYEGEWRTNRAEGKGRFQHTDGDTYCGQWQDNVAHGMGIYHHSNGTHTTNYAGEWRNDLQHGFGVEMWEEGYCYQGEFRSGQKSGPGVYTWVDGSSFKGAWRANSISGPGLYTGSDGRRFQGQWRGNMIHGDGAYSWPDGREYRGQYVNDRKSGFGRFHWPAGQRYDGYWLDGKQHGHGRYCRVDGSSVLALWVQGQWVEMSEDCDAESSLRSEQDQNSRRASLE